MLQYNEILPKKVVLYNGEPHIVTAAHVFRKQQRKPVNQAKLRSLKTGRQVETTFHQNENIEEADVIKRDIKYLYNNRGEYWFCEVNNPKERFSFPEDIIGEQSKFLKENSTVEALVFDDEIISITIPIKVELKVTEAAPAVKGNTSQGATKEVTLESGAVLQVPMFINEGDIIRVNTETNSYAERVEKA